MPQSDLAKEAAQLALLSEPVEIYRHSLRSYVFAALLAKGRNILYDNELLFVAAILHDAGLAPAHSSAHDHFQVDGANLARDVLARYGVTGHKAEIVWDAIALHDQFGIAKFKTAEVALLSQGVTADFGGYMDELKRDDIVQVLAAAPRDGFFEAFLESAAALVRRKPQTAARPWITDIGEQLVPGFHQAHGFVTRLRAGDPFDAVTPSG